jgi:poly-D-alanine transfer protein DltD
MIDQSTTNARFLIQRSFYQERGYFQSKFKKRMREDYHNAFESLTLPEFNDTNPMLARNAAYEAQRRNSDWLMHPTMRARYYNNFSFARKLRSTGRGKPVNYPQDFARISDLCAQCKEKFKAGGNFCSQECEEKFDEEMS